MLESIPLDLLPEAYRPYAVPAAILHVALFVALIVPTWRAFARAGTGGFWALVLVFPVIGILVIALMMAGGVLRRAGWSPLWLVLVLVPVVNVLFLWIFAYAPWKQASMDEILGEAPLIDAPASDKLNLRPITIDDDPVRAPDVVGPDGQPNEADRAVRRVSLPLPGYAARPAGSADPNIRKPAEAHGAAPAAEPESGETLVSGAGPSAEAGTGNGSREPVTEPLDRGRVWVLTGGSPDSRDDLRIRIHESRLRSAKDGLTIGRSSGSDFVISDESVSRTHARFRIRGTALHVEDLDSMNGTYLDGDRLDAGTPTELRVDSKLEIGKIKLTMAGQ